MFLDPPYLPDDTDTETQRRSANSESTYEVGVDWEKLIEAMLTAKRIIILCGYYSDRLNREIVGSGWKRILIDADHPVNISHKRGSQVKSTSDEYIYINFR